MASFTLEADVKAPPEVVFDVLADHRGYASISRLRKSELEREGEPDPNGVGAIRKLTAVGPPLREEIVEYVPAQRLAYRLLSGAPLRDHLGTVELTPAATGTHVTYRVETTPTLPVGKGLTVGITKWSVRGLLDGIARESERRASAPA